MERAEDDKEDALLAFFAPTCPPRGLVPHGGKLLNQPFQGIMVSSGAAVAAGLAAGARSARETALAVTSAVCFLKLLLRRT
eukprot:scaffold30118_cov72-Skeletonema_dohrnii-CCMP3373.AAC.1